jgi:acyl carrier protein phosphodiesterase
MNYLAHLLFSGDDPEWQIGGLLGDFVKGPLCGRYPPGIEAGIRRHRSIDALCAGLPATRELVATFASPWRRYAGIAIDVMFDHRLALDWGRYHPQPLAEFCRSFYRALTARRALLPERARAFCDRAPGQRLLESYRDPDRARLVLAGIGRRLARPVPLEAMWDLLAARQAAVSEAFPRTMAAVACSLASAEP